MHVPVMTVILWTAAVELIMCFQLSRIQGALILFLVKPVTMPPMDTLWTPRSFPVTALYVEGSSNGLTV